MERKNILRLCRGLKRIQGGRFVDPDFGKLVKTFQRDPNATNDSDVEAAARELADSLNVGVRDDGKLIGKRKAAKKKATKKKAKPAGSNA